MDILRTAGLDGPLQLWRLWLSQQMVSLQKNRLPHGGAHGGEDGDSFLVFRTPASLPSWPSGFT